MPGHDVIVIGASAGGVEALSQLVARLPADLPAAVFVVVHIPSHTTSVLPAILNRKGRLPARHPADGARIEHGRIYVAPPDFHLLVQRDAVRLVHGPRENGHRPAVDTLFRTAARAYGRRVVGVVLSGSLDDGTAGLMAIKKRGGVALVQDPDEALYDGMPRNAIDHVPVDRVLPLADIAAALNDLAHEPVEEQGDGQVSDDLEFESEMAKLELNAVEKEMRPGTVSVFTCPECHGVLWELQEGELTRFRCRVGHAFSADTLLAEQSLALEEAIWSAFRALEESASLARRLARRLKDRGHDVSASRFEQQAHEAEQRAALIRQLLLRGEVNAPKDPAVVHPGSSESNSRGETPPA